MKRMEHSEKDFSWSGLFVVTACCSFLFNVIIKLMDGDFSNLLFFIGGISAFLGVANWAGRILSKLNTKRRDRRLA